jgi:hypothetical protein
MIRANGSSAASSFRTTPIGECNGDLHLAPVSIG